MDNSGISQTIIAPDVQIVGTIKTSGAIQIHGSLEGDLQSQSDATIGKGAQIKGNMTVNSVVIAGTINGNIIAKDRIQMQATARVFGDIKAKRLSVEDGVTFIGRSEVNPSGQTVAGGATAPAADSDADREEGKGGLFGRK